MLRRQFVSHVLLWGAATGTVGSLSGCGTMLHPERLNQPHSRDIDWKIVALNGLGLIFFFVPGVIAFVVDFHTGAIYLPPRHVGMKPPLSDAEPASEPPGDDADDRVTLTKVLVPANDLNVATIEREVTQYVGTPVSLSEPSARAAEIESIDEFADVQQRHEADRTVGLSPKGYFQRLLR